MSDITKTIHETAQVLQDFATIVFYLHVVALLVINTTRTPPSGSVLNKMYRMLEILAGLLTPLAKR